MSFYGSNPSSPHTTNYRSYGKAPPPAGSRPFVVTAASSNGYHKYGSNGHQPPPRTPPPPVNRQPPTLVTATPARVVEDDYIQDETAFFEQNRIKQLKNERIYIQKKTFTKWVNSYLNRARLEIRDLFTDFGDGILLMKFLEIISGEKLGKPNRGQMRVQKIENLNKCLDFLKSKRIHMENIGAVDILDKNEDLILGLIWTIILRFTIENIEIEEKESGERKHAKEALLLWVQRKVSDYPNVKVDNFTSSWRNGMAFNALIHAHRPELINFDTLNPQDALGNLNQAFDIAEKRLEIARLLDAEDVNVLHPDEKSIITYVSLYYHYFAKQKTEMTGARRVGKVIGRLIEQEQFQDDFEQISSDLLLWIQKTISWLTDRHFPNSLDEMREQLAAFNEYRKNEKPPKYKEKGELEALFFAIQTKRKAMARKPYVPPQSLFIHDVEAAWSRLDHAENERQAALIDELQRQERLDLMAKTFGKKALMREQWLAEIMGVLAGVDFHASNSSVEAASKILQTIATEAAPRADRFKVLTQLSNELQAANYHGAEGIRRKERELNERWGQFQQMLRQKERALKGLKDLTSLLRDIESLSADLAQMEPAARNRDVGKHSLAIDDLLQKHELVITNLNASGEWLKNVTAQALDYIKGRGEQHQFLEQNLTAVTEQHSQLVELCQQRHHALLRAKDYFEFVQCIEDEVNWANEKIEFCRGVAHDLNNIPQLNRQFKALEAEMQSHWHRNKELADKSRHFVAAATVIPGSRDECSQKLQTLNARWDSLREESARLSKWLAEAEQASQYFHEANDAESWIREKLPLVKSTDYGRDLGAATSLSKRHSFLENDVHAYRQEIQRLDEMAETLAKSRFFAVVEDPATVSAQIDNQMEEQVVPRVKVLYGYEGNGIRVAKDEVLALLERTNADWWRILKQDGVEGYAPANYCQILPHETVTVSHRLPKGGPPAAKPDGGDTILRRQEAINAEYRRLQSFAETRRRLLADAVKLFKFGNECDDFEQWAKDTQTLITENTDVDHIAALRVKFDKLENDVAKNGGAQLKRINDMADELISEGHSKLDSIRVRQSRANQIWNDLKKLLKSSADKLEAAERLAEFSDKCADMKAWMGEKFALLSKKPESGDMRALQAQQRHYQNLKRDLLPLKDQMAHLRKLGAEIKRRHPEHSRETDRVLAELGQMHDELERQARQRIEEAEQSQGQQLFETNAAQLLHWTQHIEQQMLDEPTGGEPAEDLVKRHADVRDRISAKDYEFEYVRELGESLLRKNKNLPTVAALMERLGAAKHRLEESWRRRDDEYRQLLELQVFNREAERIDALTKGHEAFLDIGNVGDSVEGVENLLKRHADFDQKLYAQEERVKAFSDSADSLLNAAHAHSKFIARRRDEVLDRHRQLYAAAQQRRARLDQALIFRGLERDADELAAWIAEKKRIAADESFKRDDQPALERKLLKHEAFVAELKANGAQLHRIRQDGQALIAAQHFASPEIADILTHLGDEWQLLTRLVDQKTQTLGEADERNAFDRMIRDAHAKLDDIETQLGSTDGGADLRAAKELLARKAAVDQEIVTLEKRIGDIHAAGEQMIRNRHYDAAEIRSQIDRLVERFNSLQEPLDRRQAILEESLKWHQLAFDADVELQWIAEKRHSVESKATGRSLTEAMNFVKKHDQLDAELATHEPRVHSTLQQGEQLVQQRHMSTVAIRAKCDELSQKWHQLKAGVEQRRALLSWGLQREQYFSDVAEVELWIHEKQQQVHTRTDNVDMFAATRVLGTLRALSTDMAVYEQNLKSLRVTAEKLESNTDRWDDPESEATPPLERQERVEAAYAALCSLVSDKSAEMDNFIALCNYNQESQDLEAWINDQLQTAMSEDYGQDYDHLQELKSKFEEFRQNVKTGSERSVLCEKAANDLLERSPPFAREILKRQEKLRCAWTLLLDYIDSRAKKLDAAAHLHHFNQEVADLHERLTEKRVILPVDYGRDMKQVYNLILKHDTFQNEVAQLNEQLQRLLEEGDHLKRQYPGPNAEHIDQQLAQLSQSFHQLNDAAQHRANKLMAAYDLQKFHAMCRDFCAWAEMANAEMNNNETIADLQSAEWIQKEHQRMRAEIATRDDEARKIATVAAEMVERRHYAQKDVEKRASDVEAAFAKIKREWTLRNEWLAQVVQWHGFQREAAQILAAIRAKVEILQQPRQMQSVADVESQMRHFDTFSKALVQLDGRVGDLDDLAKKLCDEQHMEGASIVQINARVQEALRLLGERMDAVRHDLESALRLARFDNSVVELLSWVEEKLAVLRQQTEAEFRSLSFEDKLSHLKQHQALEIQLSTNAARIEAVRDQLNHLQSAAAGAPLPDAVKQRANALLAKWEELERRARQLNATLQEARELFDFNQAVDRVLAWIREKQLMIQAQETGNDYEHCRALIDKLVGKDANQSVDVETLKNVNRLGANLIAGTAEGRADVQHRLREMNDAWQHLQGRVEHYAALLQSALAVHRFNGDVDETNTRIHEKATALQSADNGKDLREVEELSRKQDKIERDMTAIHRKLVEHDDVAKELLRKDQPLKETIIESLRTLETSWEQLTELAKARRARLQQSYNLHKYFDSVKKTEQWAQQIRTKMASYVRPKSAEDARSLIAQHTERQVEIESRQTELATLRELGQRVTAEQPDHRAEIQRAHRRLQNIEHQIHQTWEQENTKLHKALELQVLYAQVLQTESWLGTKEAVVNDLDLGDSVDTVDMLIRKHENFEKTLHAQSDKIQALRAGVHVLRDATEPDVERIAEKYENVLQRYEHLQESCGVKRQRLEESRKLHEFIRACAELITWMNAKLQLAYDDAYIDPTNLRSKLRKHLAFDAELQQSEHRVERIREEGEKLLKEAHYESERIQAQLDGVVEGWQELRSKSANKTHRLQESYEAHQLACKFAELDNWLDQVEHELASDDHGTDVQSVEALIKRHTELQQRCDAKAPTIEETVQKTAQLRQLQYASVDEHLERADAVRQRYTGLSEPLAIRGENLAESLRFFGWAADADGELVWLSEKLPPLRSRDFGSTLHAAQSLHKKHQILQQEIDAHRTVIAEVQQRGEQMLSQQHFNGGDIQTKLHTLRDQIHSLEQLNSERSRRLSESLRSQQYYAELAEAEQWCRERLPLVSNEDTGANQSAADAHLRLVTALEKELITFEAEVRRLHDLSDGMITERHFDSTQLTTRQVNLEKLFEQLQIEWERRRDQLLDASRYYNFIRQVNDLTSWLNEKERLAMREDYGRDLEECQQLIEEFEVAIRELSASGEKVHGIVNYVKKEKLIQQGHPYEASIYNAVRELEDLWRRVNTTANDRQQALQDAQKIHIFDQEADEMLCRLEEKEAHLLAMEQEDLANVDLATVKGHCQKHEEFMKSVVGVEKQVAELCAEADRLAQLFPQTLEHLDVRRSELTEQLKDILEAAMRFAERLDQSKNKQAYFQEWRDLVTWIQHMRTTIIGEILPRDLANCEALNVRHAEYYAEIQQREPQKIAFVAEGRKMISAGNVLSHEINIRVEQLEDGFAQLFEFWHARQRVYEENYDLRKWLHNASTLEKWLAEREGLLAEDWRIAESVEQVEDMIRHYEDFLATLDAQGAQFEALNRQTKLEEAWNRMSAHEGATSLMFTSPVSRRESSIGDENRRHTQQIKTVEKKKILQEKRQERERRKTQEITLLKRTPSQENTSLGASITSATLPRTRPQRDGEPVDQFGQPLATGVTLRSSAAELGTFAASAGADSQRNSVVGSLFSGKSRGFTTRRTQSIKKMKQWHELKSIDMNGHIDRKQELQTGGKKATIRSWKNYYMILCGQLLCFFKDEESFFENMAAAPPVYILHARCVVYPEYAKRKHTFKLNSTDGSEFLFSCESYAKMMEWVEKINFHARLDPSHQLTSYNQHQNGADK